MEANELRLNNWVNHCNKEVQITIHDLFDIAVFEDDVFTPIPLTEEWLLKFGFEEKSKSKNFYLGNFRFHISKPVNYDGFIFCDGYDVITDRIKYVHQLQNLYFALTGEELVLKN